MKELWVEIDLKNIKNNSLQKIVNEKSDVVLQETTDGLSSNDPDLIVLSAFDKDTIINLKQKGKKIAIKLTLSTKEDEDRAVKASEISADYIIIECRDWKVIPLENIIARSSKKSKIIAQISSAEEAKLVLGTLELGTDGVLLKSSDPQEILETYVAVKKFMPKICLTPAKIVNVKQIGTGARACVDTCDIMSEGQGLLVGSQSAGLFLVEAEVHENPYVASRPFRVNAGSISMYTLGSLQNTRYLSELKAGDEVLLVSRDGQIKTANVGRVKIEFRPMLLLEADFEGNKIKTILQNAETIRVVTPVGSKPVTDLQVGDEVLVHMAGGGSGRHFGISVPDERVIER